MNEQFQSQILPLINEWLFDHGVKIIIIFVIAFLLKRFSSIFIEKAIRRAVRPDKHTSKMAEEMREDTLISIFAQFVNITIWIFTAMLILAEIGINTAPLIAGAGVIGLALGFGGQYLIKDLIAGFFIILENQYRIGDVICVDGGKCGLVESIGLRTTVLRDLDGTTHFVPNGEVHIASNMSKDYSRVNLDIGVSYAADIDKVEKIINEVGKKLAKDPKWVDDIVSPPQFLRIDKFAESEIVIKILGDTKPLSQWKVAGELRKRLKKEFDKEKIEIPFPQITVNQAGA